jgi:hypothetical protein
MAAADVDPPSRATLAEKANLGTRLPLHAHARERLAIPAGFEPATHGVEIFRTISNINSLRAPCTIRVSSSAKQPGLYAFSGPLVGVGICEKVPVHVKGDLNRTVAHELLNLFRVKALASALNALLCIIPVAMTEADAERFRQEAEECRRFAERSASQLDKELGYGSPPTGSS